MSAIEFEPVTEHNKLHIVSQINDAARDIERNGWPGMPEGWLAVLWARNVDALIEEGVVERHVVTQPKPSDPSKLGTHYFLSLVEN